MTCACGHVYDEHEIGVHSSPCAICDCIMFEEDDDDG
jgi:hypothetical protein